MELPTADPATNASKKAASPPWSRSAQSSNAGVLTTTTSGRTRRMGGGPRANAPEPRGHWAAQLDQLRHTTATAAEADRLSKLGLTGIGGQRGGASVRGACPQVRDTGSRAESGDRGPSLEVGSTLGMRPSAMTLRGLGIASTKRSSRRWSRDKDHR